MMHTRTNPARRSRGFRRLASAAIGLVAVVALAACAGLPTAGPVNPGVPADEVPDAPFLYYPGGPAEGASPEQILNGFLEAATSPANDWATAREFLTADFASDWEPDAHVTVDVPNSRVVDTERLGGEGIVEATLEPVATVDERGVYRTSDAAKAELAFEMEQQADGEWRVSRAPAGIVLDRDVFEDVYHDYSLYYFDPTWSYLVPDVRWFPTQTGENRIAAEMLLGASDYVSGAATTAFPQGTQLAAAGVVVDDSGAADVTLTREAASADAAQRSRMRAQLLASLASLGAQDVRMHAGGDDLSAETLEPASTRPDARALVFGDTGYDSGFGFLDAGGAIDRISRLTAAAGVLGETTSISMSADRSALVVQDDSGAVWRRTESGGDVLDERDGLIEPTIDPQGFPWSVPGDDPTQLVAYTQDYEPIAIDGGIPDAERVFAMQASPDGTRLAVLIRTPQGNRAVVLPIIRSSDGTPERLGDPVRVTTLTGRGIDIAWLDSETVGVVAEDEAGIVIVQQRVGGPATYLSSEANIVSIAAGSQSTIARLLSENGTLFIRRGSTWQPAATGIDVLATQLGAPRS